MEVYTIFSMRIDFTKIFAMSLDFAEIKKKYLKHVHGDGIHGALSPSTALF